MVPVGMGAGISAAFNAPISAITFVFEELFDNNFSSKALGGILIAVVVAAVVERSILGEHSALHATTEAFETSSWMLVCLALGPIAGLLGHLFTTHCSYYAVASSNGGRFQPGQNRLLAGSAWASLG